MNQELHDFFTKDHRRLESILDSAIADLSNIDMDLYSQFRVGLLTHIKMEEKIFFLAAQKANNNVPLPFAPQLRLEHGAITALLVPSPTLEIVKVLMHVLDIHDEVEEKHGGMYEACEKLTHHETQALLDQLRAVTPVPVHPHNDAPIALEAAKRALLRAGYDYDALVS
ncbi:hemerythrin domain-containing protein [Amniculibacterium sp. G2-70]|uniref:hemerythrin domain-containing protein n=1 Tax=Amniculibacterium sp. G2-70 TaxID=2767188 RepID=UPI0016547E73|nr:hemerythrin domain-containing protein [Amniculibacterium sp. G2-70]